jgi:hypothetical protein
MRFESQARSQRMSAKRRTLCAVAAFWLSKVAYLLCEKWAQHYHRDHRLDGGATAHLVADDLGNPADLAADPDLEPTGIAVAAIALIAVDAARRNICELRDWR